MKVQDPREFRLRFKKSKKSRDNDFNDQHFIGTQHDDITGFFGMFHGEKNDIHGFLRQNIAMAEDDQGVYEFIQNAVDAEATHFYFFYDEHNLLVINNGKKFDSNAIKSILNVGQSEGKESCDKIGKFGIGFKLIHRLVGEGSGLNEIIRDYKGPQLFSWDSLNQFQAFIHADSISQDIAVDLPWYFKIIITNFPAGVGETVKDHQYQNRIPFEESEFKEFQSFLNDVLDKMDLKALQRGSAFYLKLGKGKFQKLHQDEERLKNEVSHSLHFLGNLTTIQINDKKILKDDTLFFDKPITLQPGSEEHNALRLEEEKEQMCPVEIAYGFNRMESILASSDLKKNCTENINYYKYFPIGEEKSGFPFFIHCNVFDIGSQRRNLHKSYINEEIFNLISENWMSRMNEYKEANIEYFDEYFFQILLCKPKEKGSFQTKSLYEPLLNYIKSNTPTKEGHYKPHGQIRVKNCIIDIPLNTIIPQFYWYKWDYDEKSPLTTEARNSAKLNLSSWSIIDVIDEAGKTSFDNLNKWIISLSESNYIKFIEELNEEMESEWFINGDYKENKRKYLKFIRYQKNRQNIEHLSISDIVSDPTLMSYLKSWTEKYSGNEIISISKMEVLLLKHYSHDNEEAAWILLRNLTDKDNTRKVLLAMDKISIEFDHLLQPKIKSEDLRVLGLAFKDWENRKVKSVKDKIMLTTKNGVNHE